jgi:hypothetical protein
MKVMWRSVALLAHQGGWDEILLVTVPIVVIVVLLAIAKHRVDAQLAAGARSERQPDARSEAQPGTDRD